MTLRERFKAQRYQLTVVGQLPLGLETDVREESRYVFIWLVRATKGTRHAELLTRIYVTGHYQAITGVTCVDQSNEIPCFYLAPSFFSMFPLING